MNVADYPDDLLRNSAKILTEATIVRFDASDLMPEALNNAFWNAIVDYVNDPATLDSTIASLDRVQSEAYKR